MKKVLFVTYDFPYPADSGGKTRAYNLLKFASKDIELHLFSFRREQINDSRINHVKQLGIKDISVFRRKKKSNYKTMFGLLTDQSVFKNLYYTKKIEHEILTKIINQKIDIVHFESYYTAFYISDTIKNAGAKQILGTENIEYKLYELYVKQNITTFAKPLLNREVNKVKKEELDLIKRADLCLAVTKSENDFIVKHGAKKCEVIPNGVDTAYFLDKKENRKKNNLLFIGNFSYFPNVDAMKFFYHEVFVNLRKDITLTIVGKHSANLGISDERVEFIDYIDDIREAYAKATVMISPIRIGGGTNFKIIEAMASKTPVLAHRARIQDLGAKDGSEIVTATSAQEFIQKTGELLEDEAMQKALGQNAQNFVKQNFEWEEIGKKLNTIWKNL